MMKVEVVKYIMQHLFLHFSEHLQRTNTSMQTQYDWAINKYIENQSNSLPGWTGPAGSCTWGTLPALVTMCPSCHAWGLMTPK